MEVRRGWGTRVHRFKAEQSASSAKEDKPDEGVGSILGKAVDQLVQFSGTVLRTFSIGYLTLFLPRAAQRLDSWIKTKHVAHPATMIFLSALLMAVIENFRVVLAILFKSQLEKVVGSGDLAGDVPELTGSAGQWLDPALDLIAFLSVASATYLVAAWIEKRLSHRRPGDRPKMKEPIVTLPIGFATWAIYVMSFCWLLSILTTKFVAHFTALSLMPVVHAWSPTSTGDSLKLDFLILVAAAAGFLQSFSIQLNGLSYKSTRYKGTIRFFVAVIGMEIAVGILVFLAGIPIRAVNSLLIEHQLTVSEAVQSPPKYGISPLNCDLNVVAGKRKVECTAIIQNLNPNQIFVLNKLPLKLINSQNSPDIAKIRIEDLVESEEIQGGVERELRANDGLSYKLTFASDTQYCSLLRETKSALAYIGFEVNVKGLDYIDSNGFRQERPMHTWKVNWGIPSFQFHSNVDCTTKITGRKQR